VVTTYGRVVRVGAGREGMWVTFLNFLAGLERKTDLQGGEVSSLLQSILTMFPSAPHKSVSCTTLSNLLFYKFESTVKKRSEMFQLNNTNDIHSRGNFLFLSAK
jgi:hypothetical protein